MQQKRAKKAIEEPKFKMGKPGTKYERKKKDKLELNLKSDSGSNALGDQYGGDFGGASDSVLQRVKKI